MHKNENISYSIGLDIGTNSVGWAVTDQNFNLLKKGSKNMWGSRLFESAVVAANRRNSRSIRRRYNKRRERIRLLQEIMAEIVLKEDPVFYLRMSETTFLDDEDKLFFLGNDYISKHTLFVGEDYNDSNYYEKFPTIYHLRDYLCSCEQKVDSRLIYLALHHMVKYRGNFLYEGQNFSLDSSNKFIDMKSLMAKLIDYNELDLEINDNLIEQILILLKSKMPRKQKSDKCRDLLKLDKKNKDIFSNFFSGLVGNKFNFTKIISLETLKYNNDDIKLKFSDSTYESQLDEVSLDIGEYIEFIDDMQRMYSWIELNGIVCSSDSEISISKSMIQRYNNHKDDLKCLKKLVKDFDLNVYNELFKSEKKELHNYYNYINHPKDTTREDFYKYLEKILTKINSDEANYCLTKIENDDFLLKQNERSNGEIPYQLHLNEMIKILDHQAKYYDCLKDNRDKIISILTFRIPYYYGPLDGNDKFGWLEKNEGMENQRILPWNHDQVVDVEKTATNFMEKLTNNCTYLPNEPVMPKNSLTCNLYEVLSELNKIRIDGKLITKGDKDKIIQDLFMKKKTVKDSDLKKWCKKNRINLNCDDLTITGYQKEERFASSLNSWIDFTNIFGEINDDNYEMIEDIIKDLTIFNDDKILKRRINKLYNLTDEQTKKILNLKYTGWSRLSRKLVDGITTTMNDNRKMTILDIMKERNLNLMEIINKDQWAFKKIIEKANYNLNEGKFNYEDVANLAGSPAIKKGIWQALLIVEEITKYMKHRPANVYIEFAREEGEKKRSTSQIKRLQNIYKDLILQTNQDVEVRKQLNKEKNDVRLKNERLYLYYTQMGRCMYCDELLDFNRLFDNDTYQIDHILPRSLVPDDSIDNKVLVCANCNQRKIDDLVVPFDIRNKKGEWWEYLFKNKLISSKKYYNLLRNEINDNQIDRFINRQLVETRQIIKNVANIINNYYHDTNVVEIRANMVSEFRAKHKIYKNRNVNDFHHAHDAYIACVLGTYIKKRYPNLNAAFEYERYIRFAKKDKKKDKYGFIVSSMSYPAFDNDTGEFIWDNRCIGKIVKCFNYHDCFVTKKLESNDRELFKVTICKNAVNSDNGKTKAKIPVNKKRKNVDKYGGFEGVEYSIYAIEGKKKKKIVRTLVGVPLIYRQSDEKTKIEYIESSQKLTDVKIIQEIKKNQLIKRDGGFFYLTAATEIVPAWQLTLSSDENKLVNMLEKACKYGQYDNINPNLVDALYLKLTDKIERFYPKYGSIAKKLIDNYGLFEKLEIKDKAYVIGQILNITSSGPQNGNIKLDSFKLGSRIGRLQSQTISLDDTIFYNQSVTGLYCQEMKL